MSARDSEYKYDFYISYAESDSAWVNGFLVPLLDQNGKSHHSKCQYQLGAPKIKEMQDAVENSRRILLILSPEYLADPENEFFDFMAHEVSNNQSKYPVIPVLRQKVELPPRLGILVGLDFSGDRVDDTDIKRLLEHTTLPIIEDEFVSCPYPGLLKFYQEDANHFYGREKSIRDLTQYLIDEKCLFLIGASGSGKSSLVHAGILPRLLSNQYYIGGKGWLVRIIEHPDPNPLEKLSKVIGDGELTDLSSSIDGLLQREGKDRLVLFIDQLEEVFQEHIDSSSFFEIIPRLYELTQVYLVFTVRADFYHFITECEVSKLVERHQKNIKALSRDDLREAIVSPALSRGVYIEPVLVERLLADAGNESGVLPLLQLTMLKLWRNRKLRWIPLSAYEEIESEDGQVTGLQAAISQHADGVYKKLPESGDYRAIARRIFIRLVQFDDDGQPKACRRLSISELKEKRDEGDFLDTLSILIDTGRLLTISGEPGDKDSVVDICHESLVDHWGSLKLWIGEYKEVEKERRYLLLKLKRHYDLKKKGGLLDEEEVLKAEEWIDDCRKRDMLPGNDIVDFINKSKRSIDPGYNKKGLLLAGVLLVDFLFLFGYFYFIYNSVPVMSFILTGVLVLFLIYVTYIIKGISEKYQLKKASVFLGGSRLFLTTVAIFSTITVAIFSLSAKDAIADQKYCSEVYEVGEENYRLGLFLGSKSMHLEGIDDVMSSSPEVKHFFIKRKSDKLRCKDSFSHFVEIKKPFSINSGKEILLQALLDDREKVEVVEHVVDSSGYEECIAISSLGNKLLFKVLGEEIHVNKNSGLQLSDSCKVHKDFSEAMDLYKGGKIDKARDILLEITKKDTNFSVASYMLGDILVKKKEYEKAIDYLVSAEENQKNSSPFFAMQIATACLRSNKTNCAKQYYNKAIEYGSREPMIFNGLSVLHRIEGEYEVSKEYIDKAFEANDMLEDAVSRKYKGEILTKNNAILYYRMSEYRNALDEFGRYNNKYYLKEKYYYLSKIYEELGQLALACQFSDDFSKLEKGYFFNAFEANEALIKCN